MKKFLNYTFIPLMFLLGCEDETSRGLSRITYFPVIDLNGEQWITIPVGGSFTDPGAVARAGTEVVEAVVSGDVVDVNTPGVYVIEYTATNADDFSTVERRYIGVIAPDAAAIDLTARYQRNAGAFGISSVTRIGPGLYRTDNIGGTTPTGVPVNFYHYAGNNLDVPLQASTGGLYYCTNATVVPGTKYSWVVINSGYGTALRTFVKL